MTFDSDKLKAIISMGQRGKSLPQIAVEFNLTSDELDFERKNNEELNIALKKAEFNFKEVTKAKLYADAMSGKNTTLAKEIYLHILNEENSIEYDSSKEIEAISLRDAIIDKHYRFFEREENILISEGGSRSGKTANFIRYAILKNNYEKFDLNVIAPSYKMLNLGSFIDAKEYIEKYNIDCKFPANATQIRFKSGGVITFEVVTSENEAKRNRDNVFINEADGVPEEVANLIIGRSKGKTFIDYNPTHKFWSEKYKTGTNYQHSTFLDNPFLSTSQIEWFNRLKKAGEFADEGSPERYAYEVYCLGIYSLLSGKAYEFEDFDIVDKCPDKFDYMLSYADPSLGTGNDYFAAILFGIKGKTVYAVDVIFSQFVKAGGYVEKLKQWDKDYDTAIDHYSESNGVSGVVTGAVNEFYSGVLNTVNNTTKKEADIIVYSTTAKSFKYVRSEKIIEFLQQCVDFPNAQHDDAPDCLSRGAKLIMKYFDIV